MGRKKKRARKQHLFDDLLLPVAGLFLLYLVVKNTFNASFSQMSSSNLFGVWGISGVIITSLLLVGFLLYTLSRYIDRRNRARIVREQKYINEWFSMTPEKFEHFVAGVLEKDGYVVQKVTAYSKDHGIDGELLKNGKRYAVQVKQFRKKAVTEPDMRQFYGSYAGPRFDEGIYVTTSTFTIPAYIWAKARNIQLIDKKKLLRLVDH